MYGNLILAQFKKKGEITMNISLTQLIDEQKQFLSFMDDAIMQIKLRKQMIAKEINDMKFLSKKDFSVFADYVYSFYGEGGIYPIENLAMKHIYTAIGMYFARLLESGIETTWGGGDSVDRERVRDILINEMDLKFKKESGG